MKKETLFREIVGTSTKSKILEWFLEGRELKYTINDVVKGTGVNRQNAYRYIKKLTELTILVKHKKVKNITFYKLNMRHPIVRRLNYLFITILMEYKCKKYAKR